MTTPELKQQNKKGQFVCTLDGLRDLLGLPQSCRIISLKEIDNAIAGKESVRFVIEDVENFPETEIGDEIPQAVPHYKLQNDQDGNPVIRKFTGWSFYTGVVEQEGSS